MLRALFLILMMGSALAQSQQPPQNIGSDTQGDRAENANSQQPVTSADIAALTEQLETIASNLAKDEKAEETAQKNESYGVLISRTDLQQQRRMAVGTERLVWLSFFSLVVSAIGIKLLLENLAEARNAIKTTRELGQIELRCYMTLTGAEIMVDREGVHISVECKNIGHTPAADVEIVAFVDLVPGYPITQRLSEYVAFNAPIIGAGESFKLKRYSKREDREGAFAGQHVYPSWKLQFPASHFQRGVILAAFYATDVFGNEVDGYREFNFPDVEIDTVKGIAKTPPCDDIGLQYVDRDKRIESFRKYRVTPDIKKSNDDWHKANSG
jgi:hypothetical protein